MSDNFFVPRTYENAVDIEDFINAYDGTAICASVKCMVENECDEEDILDVISAIRHYFSKQ